jgi:hypothetical protein
MVRSLSMTPDALIAVVGSSTIGPSMIERFLFQESKAMNTIKSCPEGWECSHALGAVLRSRDLAERCLVLSTAEVWSISLSQYTLAKGERLLEYICAAKVVNSLPYTAEERAYVDNKLKEKFGNVPEIAPVTRSNQTIPNLEPFCGSWIVVSRETGNPVLETYSRDTAEKINQEKYEVLTAYQWLMRFNKEVKQEKAESSNVASYPMIQHPTDPFD